MNLTDAKKHVRDWLWENPARTTVNREWDDQYITDAAQMLMEAHCKIEQLELAYKGVIAENKRLAELRDLKTEELRGLLRKAEAALMTSCTKPMALILDIRRHLDLNR